MSKTELDQFDILASIIRKCDEMLITLSDPVEIHLVHEAQARAKDRLRLHLKEMNFEQLWALCNSKIGTAKALEKAVQALATQALATVDIPEPEPNGNIEMTVKSDGNGVVAWSPDEKGATT